MKETSSAKHQFTFAGFQSPNYTQVPDELFDVLLPDLTLAELKVLLYIIRRTFGFKKASDDIRLSQMLTGIKKRDGDTQDRGVGVSKVALLQAVRSLQQKHLIVTERRQSEEKGNEPTNYRLNVLESSAPREAHNKNTEPPLVKKVYQGVVKKIYQGVGKETIPSPWHKNLTTQETVLQETEEEQQHIVVFEAGAVNTDANKEERIPNEIANALTAFGISKLIASRLAQTYPEDYLLSKLEVAQFLTDKKSRLVAKNPAGYLRKSIEEDYTPPKAYKPKAQLEAEARERREQERLDQEERHHAEEQAHQEREQLLAHLYQQYPPTAIAGTEFTTRTAWKAVKAYLKQALPDMQSSLLEDTMLVTVQDGKATIGTTNHFLCRYLASRISLQLQQAFQITLDQPLKPHFQVLTASQELAPSQ